MTTYQFAASPDGCHHWNLLTKLLVATGQWPALMMAENEVYLTFDQPLISEQLAEVERLVKSTGAKDPPTPEGTVLRIKDLVEHIGALRAACGSDIKMYFSSSSDSVHACDVIELHCDRTLTGFEVDAVRRAYFELISVG